MFKVLLATDGTDISVHAAEYAAELLRKMEDANITALFVKDPSPDEWGWIPISSSPKEMETITGAIERQYDIIANRALDSVEKALERQGLKAERRAQWGSAAESISETAEREHFDLIVMGTKGMATPETLPASVSYGVLKKTHVPVLVVRQAA